MLTSILMILQPSVVLAEKSNSLEKHSDISDLGIKPTCPAKLATFIRTQAFERRTDSGQIDYRSNLRNVGPLKTAHADRQQDTASANHNPTPINPPNMPSSIPTIVRKSVVLIEQFVRIDYIRQP